jgi:3-deoxy-7-phosphoheptulonate synthase
MIIVLKPNPTPEVVDHVLERIEALGFTPHLSQGVARTIIGVIGDEDKLQAEPLQAIAGVEQVVPILKPYKLASREFHADASVFEIKGIKIGGGHLAMIAGPCAIESEAILAEIAEAVRDAGANILRGGAFKPRTSPYSFQGHKEDGLKMLATARDATGLAIVTEVMAPEHVPMVARYADVLQIGARNMQNYQLLQAVGDSGKPAMLKRGMSATIDEFLLAAEYILDRGNPHVMLCERGIRTYEEHTRFTLPLATVPYLHDRSHLPVVVDPSHGTGKAKLVIPMAKASVAAGADALIVEVHDDPEHAVSDGSQTITPAAFGQMMAMCRRIAEAVDRTM